MIGKKTQYGYVEISEAEKESIMNKVLEINIKELKRIIERVEKSDIKLDKLEVIKMLFDKQGIQSFTLLNNYLQKKQ
jgi:hypothetical protein